MHLINIDYVFKLIEDIETAEWNNSQTWNPINRDARQAERMKAWEKLLYWALDGVNVS